MGARLLDTLLMTEDKDAWSVVVAVARSEEILSRADDTGPWLFEGVGVGLLEEPLLRLVAAVI